MRQKNNRFWVYVILALILAVVVWVVSREIPFKAETVEQPLENTFAQ